MLLLLLTSAAAAEETHAVVPTGGWLHRDRRPDPHRLKREARDRRDTRANALRESYAAIVRHGQHVSPQTRRAVLGAILGGLEPNEPRTGLPPVERVDFDWLAEVANDADRLLSQLIEVADEVEALAARAKVARKKSRALERKLEAELAKQPEPVASVAPVAETTAPIERQSALDALGLADVDAMLAEAARIAADEDDDLLLLLAA
jgi:hypothetical protein